MKQSFGLVSFVVRDYDEALAFFVGKLGFTLVEDTFVPEQSKRWVVVAPPGAEECKLLLARASDDAQRARIGTQTGGRVFLFLHTDDFWRDYERVWLPDDDLATEQDQIDRLFAVADAAGLDLAQPSLDWRSHCSFGITLQSPSFALRYTDMVEVMAPCFTRDFLERALPTFEPVVDRSAESPRSTTVPATTATTSPLWPAAMGQVPHVYYYPEAVAPPANDGWHVRYPYYSYRRPWYPPGPGGVNVTIIW